MKKKHIFKSVDFKIESINDDEDSKVGIIKGLASTVAVDSEGEIIIPQAFSKTVEDFKNRNRQIPMRFNHNRDVIIGGFDPNKMSINEKGLFVEGKINLETEKGREVYSLLKQGVLWGFSIEGIVKKRDASNRKIVTEVELFGISVVDDPSNPDSEIVSIKYSRDLNNQNDYNINDIKTLRDANDLLKSIGFSNKAANILISKIKNATEENNVNRDDLLNKFENMILSLKIDEMNSKLKQ